MPHINVIFVNIMHNEYIKLSMCVCTTEKVINIHYARPWKITHKQVVPHFIDSATVIILFFNSPTEQKHNTDSLAAASYPIPMLQCCCEQ